MYALQQILFTTRASEMRCGCQVDMFPHFSTFFHFSPLTSGDLFSFMSKKMYLLKCQAEYEDDQLDCSKKYNVRWWLNWYQVSVEKAHRCDGVRRCLIVLMFTEKLIVSVECASKLGSHCLSVTEDKWGVMRFQSVPLTQTLFLRGGERSLGESAWQLKKSIWIMYIIFTLGKPV